jgi:hypothetical protein
VSAIGLVVCVALIPGCSTSAGGISCQQYNNDLNIAFANPRNETVPKALDDIEQPYRGQILYQRQRFVTNWYGAVEKVNGVVLPRKPANPYQQAQIIGQWNSFVTSERSNALAAKGCST